MTHKIELKTGTQYIDEDGILQIRFRMAPGIKEIQEEHIKDHIDAIVELCQGIPRPFYIDGMNSYLSMAPGACKLLAQCEVLNELRLAEAYVTDVLAIRLLFHYHLRLRDTRQGTRIFSDPKIAKHWLGLVTKENRSH